MRVLTWLVTAVSLGINLHALLALGAVLTGRSTTATERRTWAVRCAASALGFVALSAVVCGLSIGSVGTATGADPSARASRLAMGISEALNCLAFAIVGSALPLFVALVCTFLAWQASRQA